MYKTYCKIDDSKVDKERIYSPSEMNQTLDKMASACGLTKGEDGWYVGEGENSNAFAMALLNTKWFLDNAQEWLFWNLKNSYQKHQNYMIHKMDISA